MRTTKAIIAVRPVVTYWKPMMQANTAITNRIVQTAVMQ